MQAAEKTITLPYRLYATIDDLAKEDAALMRHAIEATGSAYAPYSHFHVGAAVRLGDGTIVRGSNQENAAYPSGLCAERTALFAAGAAHPDQQVTALAIVARDSQGDLCEAAPCGACRQVLAESQRRAGKPIRVLIYHNDGSVTLIPDAQTLLPFSFTLQDR